MPTLSELLGAQPKRDQLVADACKVLDDEVSDKGGLSGLAIKGAYGVIKGIKPGFIREVVDGLLDEFLRVFGPPVPRGGHQGGPAGAHLQGNPGRVADALLAGGHRREGRARTEGRGEVRQIHKLRRTAKKQVEAAGPAPGGDARPAYVLVHCSASARVLGFASPSANANGGLRLYFSIGRLDNGLSSEQVSGLTFPVG